MEKFVSQLLEIRALIICIPIPMVSRRYHFLFASDRSFLLRYINFAAVRALSLSPIPIVHACIHTYIFPFLSRDNKPSTFCLPFGLHTIRRLIANIFVWTFAAISFRIGTHRPVFARSSSIKTVYRRAIVSFFIFLSTVLFVTLLSFIGGEVIQWNVMQSACLCVDISLII